MKRKITHFLLILISVLLYFGTGGAQITVNGIINGSVTLPSGSPRNSPSEVQWTIGKSLIASYMEPDLLNTDSKRFGDRLRLNKEDGSLRIKQIQMNDVDTYTVEVSHGKSKHNAEVKLMIYELADMPILKVLSNTSGPRSCNVSVRCATQGRWVESLCQLTDGKLVCNETARNDSAHSAWLLITATRDAINCSSSNPASTSPAPLLPVTQVCHTNLPDPDDNHGHTYKHAYPRSRNILTAISITFCLSIVLFIVCKNISMIRTKKEQILMIFRQKKDPNDVEVRESKTDFDELQGNNHRTDANSAQEEAPSV